MQIDEQIQKLLRLKSKIDLYKKLISQMDLEAALKDDVFAATERTYPGVLKEFFEELISFSAKRIEMLSSSGMTPPNPTPQPVATTPKPEKTFIDNDPNKDPVDPLSFMRKYQHLYGKKVSWTTPDGTVTGVVRGIVVPYLKVDTDTGYTVTVEPKEVKVA